MVNSLILVAISHDEHILVTDEHQLQKLTYGGVCIASVGHKIGKAPLQFDTSAGITVHPTTGQIFTAYQLLYSSFK